MLTIQQPKHPTDETDNVDQECDDEPETLIEITDLGRATLKGIIDFHVIHN